MESAFKLKYLFFSREGPGGAHCLETGVGAAGGENHLIGAGDSVDQDFCQLHCFVVGGEEGAATLNRLDNGFSDNGVGVAQNHGPGAHKPVNVLVSTYVIYVGAFAVGGKKFQFRGEC